MNQKSTEGMKAFVTLVDQNYMLGALALINSLKKVSNIPIAALSLSLPEKYKSLLKDEGIKVIEVETIFNPNAENFEKRFDKIYSKLHAFNLVEYEKVVFLDSDIIVLKNIDDLFGEASLSVAPNASCNKDINTFNSGVMVIEPSRTTFDEMIRMLNSTGSYDKSDQGFLNAFFKNNYHRLDRSYNTLKRGYMNFPNEFELEKIKVLHYVGEKPWMFHSLEYKDYMELNRLWWRYFPYKYFDHVIELIADPQSVFQDKNELIRKRDGEIFRLRNCKKYKIGEAVLYPYEKLFSRSK